MGEDDSRAAIEGPAHQAGLLLEPGLVDLLVREVEGEPGALPLLSHALRQTWERREARTLTVTGYRATGGIRGAVAQSAERIYEQVPPEQRQLLRDLLLRLVAPSDDGEPVRCRVPRRTLSSDSDHEQLIERLVTARLATSDDEVVELAHEALARAWPRLRGWLDDDVEGQRVFRHLAGAADAWDQMGRPDSELYRGIRLTQALDWRDRTRADLTPTERDFLDTARRHAHHETRRQRRANRRLKALLTGVTILLVVAIVAGLLAIRQRQRADAEADIAEARRIGARALVERPHDRALLLAVEAVRLCDSPETQGNLLATIERSRQATAVIDSGGPRLLGIHVSPDGTHGVVVDHLDDVTLYDLSARREVATLADDGTSYRAPAFSPGGERVAVSAFDTSCWSGVVCESFAVEVFDARDLRPLGIRYEGLGIPVSDVAYSPQGDLLAAAAPFAFAGPFHNIAIWDVDQPGDPVMRLSLTELGADRRASPDLGPPTWVSFSPDGSRLYASGAGPTVAFDVDTGDPIQTFEGEGALALSPDGRTIAIATTTTNIGLFDTADGERRVELLGHDAMVTAAAFSPDGEWVATASNDETVAVWDTATGQRVHLLEGHFGSVLGVDFSSDGTTLYSSAADRSVMLWDLEGAGGVARRLLDSELPAMRVNAIWVSPTADTVAVGGEYVHLIELGDGRPIKLQAGEPYDEVWGAYSPGGERFVTVAADGALMLWNVADGELLASRSGRGSDNYGAVAFAADGSNVVVADADGIVAEYDGRTLEPTGRSLDVGVEPAGIRTTVGGVVAVTSFTFDLSAATDIVFGDVDDGRVLDRIHVAIGGIRANFSPDGSAYAIGGYDGRLGVIDVASGELVGPRDPVHSGPVSWVTFSPDGTTLASMGFDGELALSDAATATPRARVRPGPSNLGSSVGYDPDGHSVIVAYEDGSVLQLNTDTAGWIEHACRVAGRNLTADEWRDAFGERAYRETCPPVTTG